MSRRGVSFRRACLAALLLFAMAAPGQAADNDTRLAEAAMRRDVAAVRTLIGQKVDANTPGQDGTPALHWAVRVDDVATAKLLLGAGAQATLANRYGLTPLAIASANGNAAMIGVLLDAGADANAPDPAGDTPLMNAARVGSMDAVTAAARSRLDDRRSRCVISADRADGRNSRESPRRREVTDLARCIGQREDTSRPRTAVDLPELGTRLRSWDRDRARRTPATRIARTDSRRDVAAALRRARRAHGHRSHAARGGGQHQRARCQRHHAAHHRDHEQPSRRRPIPDRPWRRHQGRGLVRSDGRCGPRSRHATWTWTTPRSSTASIARRISN